MQLLQQKENINFHQNHYLYHTLFPTLEQGKKTSHKFLSQTELLVQDKSAKCEHHNFKE